MESTEWQLHRGCHRWWALLIPDRTLQEFMVGDFSLWGCHCSRGSGGFHLGVLLVLVCECCTTGDFVFKVQLLQNGILPEPWWIMYISWECFQPGFPLGRAPVLAGLGYWVSLLLFPFNKRMLLDLGVVRLRSMVCSLCSSSMENQLWNCFWFSGTDL